MNFSDNGFSLLKELEGCRLKAYKDVAGVWTIGFGATGPDVYEGLVISQEQADAWLRQDVKYFEEVVNTSVSTKLNQNEFDALVCFSFNVGAAAFKNSTLFKLLNSSTERTVVASEFLKWCKADGKVVEGLKRRREREKSLFLTKALHPLLTTSILAQKDTWLKREPSQAADLPAEKKLFVPKGSAHEWASITMVPGQQHYKLSLKAQPDATWWFWPADFKIINDAAVVKEEPPIKLPKLVLDVPYFSQRDNYTNPLSTCYSSSCAMLLKYLKPDAIASDDEYLKTVYKFGESEEATAQIAALKYYGLQAEFQQHGSWSDLESLLVQGIPIPIGILHKGPVSNPTGNGHWITVIGRTEDNKGFVVNDPFGDLDLVRGTYVSTSGDHLTYSKKNLGPRWMVPVSGNGWFIKAKL